MREASCRNSLKVLLDKAFTLQKAVLYLLATKPTPLKGRELRFIIDYFEMSYRDFAKLFGVSHVAVVKSRLRSAPVTHAIPHKSVDLPQHVKVEAIYE
jgi:hypothetical protein